MTLIDNQEIKEANKLVSIQIKTTGRPHLLFVKLRNLEKELQSDYPMLTKVWSTRDFLALHKLI